MSAPDVRLETNITDVRCKVVMAPCQGGIYSDYVGQVETVVSVRITDHNNDPTGSGPFTDTGTVSDFLFSYASGCAINPTGAPLDIGGTCNVLTRAGAVIPGGFNLVAKRQNIQFGQVQVNDGGSSGVVGAADKTLFETQGIFIP